MGSLSFNPFASDAYSLVNMTTAFNIYPNQYGLVSKMNIFNDQPLMTKTALIERRNNVLNLIPSTQWGGPPPVNTSAKRDVVSFPVPHIPVVDSVLPSDVNGIRAFGSGSTLDTIDDRMALKLQEMGRKLDITVEFLRVGALRGLVVDGDGATTLANLFTVFGVTQQVINFPFSTTTTQTLTAVQNLSRYFEDNLKGETMDEVIVLCSGTWWDAFITHPNVVIAYQYFLNNQNILRDDFRKIGFVYQGVRFIEYRGHASLPSGTDVKFVPTDEAIAFPIGTSPQFAQTFFAPAEFNETVNTMGLPRYAKQAPRRMDQGWDIWTETNPLPIVNRPDLLVRITRS
jgi:hypothetical protein